MAVRVDVDGTMHNEKINQSLMHTYLDGNLTFVGAIPEIFGIAIGTSNTEGALNRHLLHNHVEQNVRGRFYIVGSDEEGKAIDVSVEKVSKFRQ